MHNVRKKSKLIMWMIDSSNWKLHRKKKKEKKKKRRRKKKEEITCLILHLVHFLNCTYTEFPKLLEIYVGNRILYIKPMSYKLIWWYRLAVFAKEHNGGKLSLVSYRLNTCSHWGSNARLVHRSYFPSVYTLGKSASSTPSEGLLVLADQISNVMVPGI